MSALSSGALEPACAVIVATWVVMRVRREAPGARAAFAARLAAVAAAAWIGEETSIRLYDFYGYAPGWSAFLDRVPLAIVCIWPVVVLSALDLARALVRARPRAKRGPALTAFTAMLLVIADASLIEPIAVKSGLWSWTEPGPFHVPVVGVLGWGFFTLGAALLLERTRAQPRRAVVRDLGVVVAGPLAAHALLLASWWLALRWLPRGVDATPFVVVAWLLSAGLAVAAARGPVRLRLDDLLLRAPAAAFFFVLLALYARDDVRLCAYAVAFAPPYLVLTARATKMWETSRAS